MWEEQKHMKTQISEMLMIAGHFWHPDILSSQCTFSFSESKKKKEVSFPTKLMVLYTIVPFPIVWLPLCLSDLVHLLQLSYAAVLGPHCCNIQPPFSIFM